MTHGTVSGYYSHGCRCDDCQDARRAYQRRQRYGDASGPVQVDEGALAELLAELFPLGLTEDCPAARLKVGAR